MKNLATLIWTSMFLFLVAAVISRQGDQIGRMLAIWGFFFLWALHLKNMSSTTNGLSFWTGASYVLNLKKWLGIHFGRLVSQKHPVALSP
jgi:hypothetical protein